MSILPKEKVKKKTDNPKNLIMFGLPKVGKTTLLSMLPKCLILDFEEGTDYVESYSVKIKNYKDLYLAAKELRGSPGQFEFVAFDTTTALEDMAIPYANKLYRDTPMGRNFDPSENILNLPNGAGYQYLRTAVQKMIGWFDNTVPNIILIGHVKEKSLNENGTELNIKDLDLTGKIGRILSAASDAICYVYRDTETGNVLANFGDGSSVLCGARIEELSGKVILLSEKLEDGTIKSYWENIYPSLKQ